MNLIIGYEVLLLKGSNETILYVEPGVLMDTLPCSARTDLNLWMEYKFGTRVKNLRSGSQCLIHRRISKTDEF